MTSSIIASLLIGGVNYLTTQKLRTEIDTVKESIPGEVNLEHFDERIKSVETTMAESLANLDSDVANLELSLKAVENIANGKDLTNVEKISVIIAIYEDLGEPLPDFSKMDDAAINTKYVEAISLKQISVIKGLEGQLTEKVDLSSFKVVEQKIITLLSQITNLEVADSASASELRNLIEEFKSDATQSISNLEKRIEGIDFNAEFNKIQSSISDILLKVADFEIELSNANASDIADLLALTQTNSASIQTLSGILVDRTKTLNSLVADMQAKSAKITELVTAIDNNASELNAHSESIEALKVLTTSLSSSYASASQSLNTITNQVTHVLTEIDGIKNAANATSQAIADNTNDIEAINVSLNNLNESLNSNIEAISTGIVNNAVGEVRDIIFDGFVNNQLEYLDSMIEMLEENDDSSEEDRDAIRSLIESFESSINNDILAANTRVATLEAIVNQIDLASLQQGISDTIDAQITQVQNQIDSLAFRLTGEVNSLESTLTTTINNSITNLSSAIDTKFKNYVVHSELNSINAKMTQLESLMTIRDLQSRLTPYTSDSTEVSETDGLLHLNGMIPLDTKGIGLTGSFSSFMPSEVHYGPWIKSNSDNGEDFRYSNRFSFRQANWSSFAIDGNHDNSRVNFIRLTSDFQRKFLLIKFSDPLHATAFMTRQYSYGYDRSGNMVFPSKYLGDVDNGGIIRRRLKRFLIHSDLVAIELPKYGDWDSSRTSALYFRTPLNQRMHLKTIALAPPEIMDINVENLDIETTGTCVQYVGDSLGHGRLD